MNELDDNPWLTLANKPDNPEWNLICFPFAGGYAEYFLPWYRKINACGLYPIQLPGRSSRWKEPALTHIDALIDAITPVLLPIIEQRPYVLFGHSMGGYISYAFAKKMKTLGAREPLSLVVSAIPAPNTWQNKEKLSELPNEEFSDFFKALGGFHPEILKHESFISSQMALLQKDVMLCESCQYDRPAQFAYPIIALSANEDPYVTYDKMDAWRDETTNEFQLKDMIGDHFYLNKNQNIDQILTLIQNEVIKRT